MILLLAIACTSDDCSDATGHAARLAESDAGIEVRLCLDTHHFGTVLRDTEGAVAFRPHPTTGPDNWGVSLYPEAFLPGATLRDAVLGEVSVTTSGILVGASGPVVSGVAEDVGTWSWELLFTATPETMTVDAVGTYGIELDAALDESLDVFKIASNHLVDVPRLSGGTGSTGDTSAVDWECDGEASSWDMEANPSHFPQDTCDVLRIDASGSCNEVDTAALGDAPIQPAIKPSLEVELSNTDSSGLELIFGAIFDTSLGDDPYADNVGITPLVLETSTRTSFSFDIWIQSRPL